MMIELYIQVSSLDLSGMREKLFAAQQERKQALLEKDEKVHEAYNTQKAHTQALEKIEKLSVERDHLLSKVDLVQQQLDEAVEETKSTAKYESFLKSANVYGFCTFNLKIDVSLDSM